MNFFAMNIFVNLFKQIKFLIFKISVGFVAPAANTMAMPIMIIVYFVLSL